ncbi:MAG: hypothetical protein FJY37_14925 [Betaproteobacteria bacterium]|nr:hypothetical protein [Betaproteobacteria bacterium]
MKCLECGEEFHCGVNDAEPCWCARDFPAILPVPDASARCLCARCLRKQIPAAPQRDDLPPVQQNGAP